MTTKSMDLKCGRGSKPVLQPGEKYYSTRMLAELNPMWKGDQVGRLAIHAWVHRHVPIPASCEICHEAPPVDAANISQEYRREKSDWQWLCRRCHMESDGRLERLKQRMKDGDNRRGEKAYQWKGDNACNGRKKLMIAKLHKKPANCEKCGKETPWLSLKPLVTDPSRTDIGDWTWWCRSCERPIGWMKKK